MFYSQDGQDSFLETYIFKGYTDGFFVDVGAHDGRTINNTLHFEEKGWKGINIEPIKEVYEKLCLNRPNCVNINCAVSSVSGDREFILNKGYTEMLSGLLDTFHPNHFQRLYRENMQTNSNSEVIHVKTKRLDEILEDHNVKRVHYLSIDVEGAECEVIKSINFERVFIDVIGFEDNYKDASEKIVSYLVDKGYRIIHKSLDIFMIHKNSMFSLT